MKKLLKSLGCIVCIFAIMLTCFTNVFASTDDIVFDLKSLGVLDGIEESSNMDEYVTRSEFAKLVVNAMGYSEIAETMNSKGYFLDVNNTPYVGAINLLCELNVLSGTGANTFSPDGYVTYAQVGKIMVNVLGYSNIVKNGDLNSYYYQAGILGVYDNTNTSGEYVTRKDIYTILHNCLNIDLMTENFGMFGTGSYQVVEGNTLKSYLKTAQHHKLTKMKGVVTADCVSYLYTGMSKNKTNLIEIDGKTYNCNFEVPRGLVGMDVDFYVEYNSESDAIVTAITPSDRNTVVEFDLEDFISASENVLKYNENDNDVKIKYSQTTKMMYNNRRELGFTPASIGNYKDGTVRVIDNNDDEIYDVMYITQYDDAVVDRVYTDNKQVYFAYNMTIDGARYLSLDEEDYIINITDSEGNALSVEDVAEDSVLSIARSTDGEVITVVVSDKKVTGEIKVIDDDYITIGTDVYVLGEGVTATLGKHVDAYINFRGEIVYFEETVSYDNYAYVLMSSVSTKGFDEIKIALLTPGHINETKKDEISEEGASSTSKKLFFRNDGKEIYTLASKVSVDGKKLDNAAAVKLIANQIISYTLNEDGKISKVEIIKPYDDDIMKTYNENGKVFSKGSGRGFGISESDTMSICIPDNIANASDDDLLVPVMLLNSTEYRIRAYDVDEESSIAGLVVVTEKMQAGLPGSVTNTSDVAVVKKVARKYDGDVEKIVVNMITKDGEKNYFVSSLIPDANRFATLSMGDLIAYTLVEGNEELNGFRVIQDANEYNGTFLLDAFGEDEMCLGTVTDCDYNFVSQTKSRWTDSMTVNYGTGTTTYEVFMTGTPPIYLLEGENTIKTLTFDDIRVGDKVFVSANLSVVRAIVVRR